MLAKTIQYAYKPLGECVHQETRSDKWDTPWYSVYIKGVCVSRNYKWQVGYSMVQCIHQESVCTKKLKVTIGILHGTVYTSRESVCTKKLQVTCGILHGTVYTSRECVYQETTSDKWDTPWYSAYIKRVCVPRNYKWLVGKSMVQCIHQESVCTKKLQVTIGILHGTVYTSRECVYQETTSDKRDTPWYSVYIKRVCVPRNYKWQVGYSMVQ